MRIGRVRRRWTALVTLVLAILVVRLVMELANRVRYGMIVRQDPSANRVISAVATDRGQLKDDPTSNNERPEQLDVNWTAVDLRIYYPVYMPALPRFVTIDDRLSFISDSDNRAYLAAPPEGASQLVGRVRVVRDGIIRRGHECSWRTSSDEFDRLGDGERSSVTFVNKTLCPLLVPDGQTFQHFVDGVLPKLVQLLTAAPRLAAAVDLFVVYRPRDAIIYELLQRVGIASQRLMQVSPDSRQVLSTPRLVDTCVTPSLHPRLWRRASQLLQACQDRRQCDVDESGTAGRTPHCLCGKPEQKTWTDDPDGQHRILGAEIGDHQQHVESKTANSSLVVLFCRRWTRNGGRHLLNENAVLEYLVGRFGRQRVAMFGAARVDLKSASRVFSRAVAVIGVHGGAFYNIILAPPGCVVVELIPAVARHVPPRRLAHTVVWRMADALGHTYWRLYATASSPRGDVTLSIDKLRSALSSVT